MAIGRFFGVFFVLFGIGVLGRDMWAAHQARAIISPVGLSQLWYQSSPTSLMQVQQIVVHNIGGRAWDIIAALMSMWAFVALLLIGAGLLVSFHRRLSAIE